VIYLTLLSEHLEDAAVHPANLVIEDQGDYLRGYQKIAEAIHSNKECHVLVKDKTVGRWLKIMTRRYGPIYIQLEELNLHKQIRNQIGLDIPAEFNEQQLLDSGLLDLKIPALPNISFEDYILEIFFGNFLTLPGGLRRVGEIVVGYDLEQWQSALSRPVVREIYRKRVRQLRKELQAAGELAELQILDWIDTSPEILIRNLAAFKLLSGYPESLGKRVLGKSFVALRKLNLDLHKVPVTISGNEKVIDEIRLYLEEKIEPDSAVTLDDLLSQISGFLEIEFNNLHKRLTAGDVAITPELITKIKAKFQALSNIPRLNQALADLDLLISVSPPSTPDKNWQADEWIDWATKYYLPYRFWLENTGQLDDQIGEIASDYADWLYQHYGQLIYHSEHMAWKAIHNLQESFKTHTGTVLVVIVDNLNAKFYPELQAQMQHRGYFEHSLSYCFSMLPSCTEVSKKCLITGHYAPFTESAYQARVESIWNNRLGKRTRYLGNIGEFRLITKREADVYFLNYLPLDITLHQSENQTGISHSQAIRSYLESLTQDIRSFARRIGAERDLLVVIISDHGSTRIPKGTLNVLKGDFYKKRALDEHHRYIAISDDELEKLPDNSQYDCYLFNRQIFELNTNYLVARRLYRFLPTDESAYIHGGLTPEETLVPVAVYSPVTISPKPMAVELISSGKLYVGTKLELVLEITNYNNYACEHVSLEFLDSNIEAEKQVIKEITKLQRITINLPARCPRTANPSAKKLHLQLSYRFLGQPWEHSIELPVEIIEPAKAKFDLDNL